MGRLKSVCPTCGTVFERWRESAYCDDCKPPRDYSDKASSTARGYDSTWARLSKRARRLQPFCTDCGSEHDLTADHTVEAWQRKAQGKAIRLRDIDVVCRICNSERGQARGDKISDRRYIVDAERQARRDFLSD